MPRRFASSRQGEMQPPCSWSVLMTSSPGGQVEAVGEEVHAHRRVLRERDVGGGRVDELPHRAADIEQRLVSRQRLAVRMLVRPVRELAFRARMTPWFSASTTSRGDAPSVPVLP